MAFGGGLRIKARGDSLSKTTRPAQHTWHSTWLFTCFVGMCAGFMLSQRLYLHWHTLASPSVPSSPLQAAGDSLALQPLPAQPRSELDSILRHIAPQREVMVAISNYAPVAQGMLPTFLEVRPRAGIWVPTAEAESSGSEQWQALLLHQELQPTPVLLPVLRPPLHAQTASMLAERQSATGLSMQVPGTDPSRTCTPHKACLPLTES